ncbi:cell wall-binding repeat-containing protein [Glutamicibacter arilaitensis]|uniref:cell wall-binding repeat-containing protein n=1 Tax=Glutamicibacter arilaitensis TaxID=256701 RepID=UPI003F9026CB
MSLVLDYSGESMPASRTRRSKALSIAVVAALSIPLSAGPSFAAPSPEPSVQSTQSRGESPSSEATTAPSETTQAAEESAPTPAPASSTEPAPTVPATQSVDPSVAEEPVSTESAAPSSVPASLMISEALAENEELSNKERTKLADQALSELDMERLDAQMGQGALRVAETGDPTVPTLDELADLAKLAGAENEDVSENELQRQLNLASPASLEELRTWRPPGTLGIDVSRHQGTVNWATAKANGARFAYIKATQSWPSSLYKDPKFSENYTNSRNAGLIRGAYHFALPAHSSGATQAKEFVANGGGWSNDGYTMPPLLDIEWNPYSKSQYPDGKGDMCYGMSPSQMVTWIKDFGNTVKAKTGRLPMIYTAQSWWDECTGDSTAFKSWPLHVSIFPTADVAKNPRELPEGWTTFNVWQYSSNSNLLGSTKNVDANVWNGDLTSLRDFAKNQRSTAYKLTTTYLGNRDVWPTRLMPVRMYGRTRFDTPVDISRRTFPSKASTVVIASGERFPDALSGSPLATLKNAPMLLVKKGSLPPSVTTELKRLRPNNIIVLGGPLAVSDKTVSELKAYGNITRVWGSNLYDTSSKISRNWSKASSVYLATGERFEDAMSLAAVVAGKKSPMLLTKKSSLPASTIRELKRLNPSHIYMAGGPIAISDAVERQVKNAVPNAAVIRFQGATRYDTSALIAKRFWPNGAQRQFIATASDFPDGLTGAVVASYNGAPLLLSKKTCMPSSVANAMRSMEGWTNVLLGGPLALDDTVAYKLNGTQNIC